MKLNFLKFALLSIILVAGTSCVKDNVDSIEGLNGKTASFQIAQSRLALDGTTFAFETGDKVGVYFNNGTDLNLEGNVTVEGDVATVTFTHTGEIAGENMVVYHPYNAANNGKAFSAFQINVPTRQTQAADGEFDGANHPLLSNVVVYGGEHTVVALHHLGAVVKFNVYGNADEKVKNVSISTDGYGKVFSSGNATVNHNKTSVATPDDNGVDVTLATPTYSGASKAEGTVAYASIYGIGAGERAKNVYVAVTTDKALYTWTRSIVIPAGAGQVLNLNLETADDEYPVKTYTTTPTGRMASQLYNAHNEREYVMGERTWVTANLRWRGYCGELGTPSEHSTHAKEFGTYYNYYEAANTVNDGGYDHSYSLGAKAIQNDKQGVDEMGLSLKYTLFNPGATYGASSAADAVAATQNLNVALLPTSDAGKTMRGQWQFVCPKGYHLSNYLDWYHLAIAVSDTYARGTSWTNGEAGFSGSYFDEADKEGTSPKNPFCNAAVSRPVDPITTTCISMGFVMGQSFYSIKTPTDGTEPVGALRTEYWGLAAGSWLRAGTNQSHGGLWADYKTHDTENGYYYKYNDSYKYLPIFVNQTVYEAIYAASNHTACNPATMLVNAGYGTGVTGSDFVGFNAYPAGWAAITEGSGNYGKWACFLQPMTLSAKGNNGTVPIVQLDSDDNNIRMINGKSRSNGTGNQYSVRCVKNYEHYDLK